MSTTPLTPQAEAEAVRKYCTQMLDYCGGAPLPEVRWLLGHLAVLDRCEGLLLRNDVEVHSARTTGADELLAEHITATAIIHDLLVQPQEGRSA